MALGTYWKWINSTKGQRLENIFDCGPKMFESCRYDCPQTNALLTLLASDWYGDTVVFVPDDVAGATYHGLSPEQLEAVPDVSWASYEYAEDYYEDIAGVFKCAKGKTWLDYDPDDPHTHFVERPYRGPFNKDIVQYCYVTNESKHEWIDRLTISDHRFGSNFDFFPYLLSDCCFGLELDGEPIGFDGIWIGDTVRPSHEPPGEGYTDMTDRIKWW